MKKWIDDLPGIVSSYNATPHSSLGAKPSDITQISEDESRLRQYLTLHIAVLSKAALYLLQSLLNFKQVKVCE